MWGLIIHKFFIRFFIIGVMIFLHQTSIGAEKVTKVALLPFRIHASENLDHLKEGIFDMIASRITFETNVQLVEPHLVENSLAKLSSVRLGKEVLQRIGEELDVEFIIFGSITKIGDNFSIDARIFNVLVGETPAPVFAHTMNIDEIIPKMNELSKDFKQIILTGSRLAQAKIPSAYSVREPAVEEKLELDKVSPSKMVRVDKTLKGGEAEGAKSVVVVDSKRKEAEDKITKIKEKEEKKVLLSSTKTPRRVSGIDTELLSKIERGRTTKDHIKEMFGTPDQKGFAEDSGGSFEFWSYISTTGKDSLLGSTKAVSEMLKITFKEDIVANWEYSKFLPESFEKLKKKVKDLKEFYVSDLLKDPKEFEGKTVRVEGVVQELLEDRYVRGVSGFAQGAVRVQKFSLSDGKNSVIVYRFSTEKTRLMLKPGETLLEIRGKFTNGLSQPTIIAHDRLVGYVRQSWIQQTCK